MNKQDISFVALLVVALFGWMWFQSHMAPPRPAPQAAALSATNVTGVAGAPRPAPAAQPAEGRTNVAVIAQATGPAERRAAAEVTLVLTNAEQRVAVTSWGGGVSTVELLPYPETRDPDSGPVRLDFGTKPALSYAGIPGLTTNSDFEVAMAATGSAVVVSRVLPDGLRFERTIRLDGDYRLQVSDAFVNEGAGPVLLPRHTIALGPVSNVVSSSSSGGYAYLGVDTLPDQGGSKVVHWGKKVIPGLFGSGGGGSFLSCQRANTSHMPASASHTDLTPCTWAAAKNKFFVQVLSPSAAAAGCELFASRNTASSNAFLLAAVSASLIFPEQTIAAGERLERRMSYYAGPKKDALLAKLGAHQGDVMEFGSWSWYKWLCRTLLWTLNALHRAIPNYGIAIILLTLLVRLIFWPVMHKSNEGMKRMQKIQPLLTALREKYKGDPKKLQEKTMELYREHKVNPMASCLPLLVQMPIFFALFTVLRSAVELRYAGFLWIRDLSEPENLLAGVLPIALNILPLVMTGLTVWQQKLTPSSGDPQQQRMMMFMSIFMLFIFYSMASALTLYWTTSQFLAILQLLMQHKKGSDATPPRKSDGAGGSLAPAKSRR